MIRSFKGKVPKIHPRAFVHASAEIIGDVEVKAYASIWPYCVLRGDTSRIVINERANLQDGVIVHCDKGIFAVIGKNVTIGHGAVIHGSKIADNVLVGMGSIVLAAKIGSWSLIGAGALILDGTAIPPRSLVLGSPGRIIRKVTAKELALIRYGAKNYLERQIEHRKTSFALEL